MKPKIMALLFISGLLAFTQPASAKLRIVASSSDLASIAEIVGGNNVKVDVIAKGTRNLHFVEILPSYMLKVARADIYLKVGLDLDFWANQIIDGSGNGDLAVIDCSQGIDRLEIPTTKVDPSMGDIHVKGNPHYWLDPANGLRVAQTIAEAMKHADPKQAATYDAGLEGFRRTMDAKTLEWDARKKALNGTEIIAYHNSWPYFAQWLGVRVLGFVEPKPGIEPSPSHTARLIDLVNAQNVKVIGMEPYYSDRAPKTIARQTGALVVKLPTSVGGVKEASDYFKLFDTLIDRLTTALAE